MASRSKNRARSSKSCLVRSSPMYLPRAGQYGCATACLALLCFALQPSALCRLVSASRRRWKTLFTCPADMMRNHVLRPFSRPYIHSFRPGDRLGDRLSETWGVSTSRTSLLPPPHPPPVYVSFPPFCSGTLHRKGRDRPRVGEVNSGDPPQIMYYGDHMTVRTGYAVCTAHPPPLSVYAICTCPLFPHSGCR